MDAKNPKEPGSFQDDYIEINMDGPADTNVKPCRLEMLPYVMGEREKLIQWGKMDLPPLPPQILETLALIKQKPDQSKH